MKKLLVNFEQEATSFQEQSGKGALMEATSKFQNGEIL